MLKRTFGCCLGLVIALQFCFIAFQSAPSVSASSVSVPSVTAMSKIVTTDHKSISPDQCNEIKHAVPGHDSDPNACVVTITHTIVGPSVLLSKLNSNTMRLQPNARNGSCSSGGNTASAYDDLSYSYLWKEELYTQFHYYGSGCTPSLVKNNGYVKYSIVGLTALSQSTGSYTNGTNVTAFENIQSTNGLFGWGVQYSSCQSRSLDGWGDWPYYSNLYAQDC